MPCGPKYLPGKHPKTNATTTTERGYGWDHQEQRRLYLARHPVCEACRKAWSTDLHHRNGDPFDKSLANLQAVCEACHHDDVHGGKAGR